jgi:uncharacterized repeat protein (TIGR03803 family)
MTQNRICDLFAVALLVVTVASPATIAHSQTYSVLYNFGSKAGDPLGPYYSGIIAQGRDGNLYSTTQYGGSGSGHGAVFKITPAGTLTVLYSSSTNDVYYIDSGLTLGTDGDFYGTTEQGGANAYGSIFKITPGGSLTTLYSFTGKADGSQPFAPPIEGIDGNFYGTASNGSGPIYGSAYKITPAGKLTVLHTFDDTDGYLPYAPLVQATNGRFYGTTNEGGFENLDGTVFGVTSSGKFTSFDFDGTDGEDPYGPLIQGSDGNFYGTARDGGASEGGVVFKFTPAGKFTILHSFDNTGGGGEPIGGLVQASDGNLYGTTSTDGSQDCGSIFRISPNGKNFKTLYTFPGDKSLGCNPLATLVQHTNGIIYGDTEVGGAGSSQYFCPTGGCGVFFSLNASLPPFVALLPYSGKVGKTIEFLGQGFTSKTTVSFNGTAAKPTVVSGTYLTAAVPAGATTGSVTVTSGSTTLNSNKIFRVTPQILSFKPTSGTVGTVVTITGVSLKQTTKVTFGGVRATTVTVVNDTQVKATVPTGAKTGHIAITTLGGTAISSGVFTVTQ